MKTPYPSAAVQNKLLISSYVKTYPKSPAFQVVHNDLLSLMCEHKKIRSINVKLPLRNSIKSQFIGLRTAWLHKYGEKLVIPISVIGTTFTSDGDEFISFDADYLSVNDKLKEFDYFGRIYIEAKDSGKRILSLSIQAAIVKEIECY